MNYPPLCKPTDSSAMLEMGNKTGKERPKNVGNGRGTYENEQGSRGGDQERAKRRKEDGKLAEEGLGEIKEGRA